MMIIQFIAFSRFLFTGGGFTGPVFRFKVPYFSRPRYTPFRVSPSGAVAVRYGYIVPRIPYRVNTLFRVDGIYTKRYIARRPRQRYYVPVAGSPRQRKGLANE